MLITENSEVLRGICFVVFLIAPYIICLEFLPPPSCLFFFGPPWTNAKPKNRTLGPWGDGKEGNSSNSSLVSTSPGLVGDSFRTGPRGFLSDWSAGASLNQMVGASLNQKKIEVIYIYIYTEEPSNLCSCTNIHLKLTSGLRFIYLKQIPSQHFKIKGYLIKQYWK